MIGPLHGDPQFELVPADRFRMARKSTSSGRKKSGGRNRAEQAAQVARILKETYPVAECALVHKSPYELVVATILSAQCTDARVNMTTPALFKKYPTARHLADSTQEDVERIVKPLGFFRAKATNIRGMAKALVEEHGGELPRTLDAMVKLPGVGRKTANVVLGVAFGMPTGVVVDTHVRRLTNLIGLVGSKDPVKIEQELVKLLPPEEWIDFSHRLIHHGRKICIARRPKCPECPLLPVCDRVGLPPLE